MSEHTLSFVRRLVREFPGLAPVFEEHVADFDEVLPHMFFGGLTRWALSLLEEGTNTRDPAAGQELRRLLDTLEATYATGDEELQDLISVSFLEHLPRPGESGEAIRTMLGPDLSTQLKVIG